VFKIDNKTIQEILRLYEAEKKGSTTISRELGITPYKICDVVNKYGKGCRSYREMSLKYSCDEDFYEAIDTESKAYWLGFMYADGFLTRPHTVGLTLSVKDIGHLEKYKKSLSITYPTHTYEPTEGSYSKNQYSRVTISSPKMCKDLIKQGVIFNKTLKIKRPCVEKDLEKHFIRGYADGDGCITSSKNNYAFKVIGTLSMLDYIKEFIEYHQVAKIHKYYKRQPTDIVSSIDMSGNRQVLKLLELLYGQATIYLDRKYERYQNLKEHSRLLQRRNS